MAESAARLTLVLGGARSGKSRFAEQRASVHPNVLYVATAQAFDAEMTARIDEHRRRRPATWRTLEAPTGVAAAIGAAWAGEAAVLVEDLGLLATNLLLREADPDAADFPAAANKAEDALAGEIAGLLDWLAAATGVELIVVSQEVGQGLVPATPLGRAFRDTLGRANQRLARAAGHAFLVVAGWAVDLTAIGTPVDMTAPGPPNGGPGDLRD